MNSIKRKPVKRVWDDAEAKRGPCRVCGSQPAQLAHTIGRKHDPVMVGPRGGEYRYVQPASVVPLCESHHRAYDAHDLDLLPYLDIDEQLNAVDAAGGIYLALVRLCPSENGKAT